MVNRSLRAKGETKMIRFVKEIELEDFGAWSGGLQVLNAIKEHDSSAELLEAVGEYINMCEEVTETWVNDFLWFDAEDIIREQFEIELFE